MGPKKSTKIRRGKRPDTSTNKPKRIAPTKKRRHASPVTSSQNSCTGEAYPRKLAVRPVEMAWPWHPLGVHHLSSSSDDLELLNMLQLLSPSSSSSEEDERTIPISGQEYTTSLLNGDPDTMRETLRVDARTFRALVKLLSEQGGSHWDHMRLSVAESLAIFLYICGQGKWFQGAADRFQHSTDTISEHFKYMMRALCNLAPSVISPPDLNEIPLEILHDNKYYLWFENCVGAIGGTLVESWVPGSHEVTDRGRKVDKTQKVMAVCSFDEKFTFVYSGWEGYARNSVVFGAMVSNPRNRFPNPPANKYYLVDAGYTNLPGYLGPYRGQRHHKDNFNGVNTEFHSKMDLFNHKHSSLRNVVERCFGALKARFPILKAMPEYHPVREPLIVIACCVVQNLVLIQRGRDEFFKQIGEEVGHGNVEEGYSHIYMSREAMATTRDEIGGAMWEAYANGN